jgi:hypothetical protein
MARYTARHQLERAIQSREKGTSRGEDLDWGASSRVHRDVFGTQVVQDSSGVGAAAYDVGDSAGVASSVIVLK